MCDYFVSTTKKRFSVYDISSWPHKQDSTYESVDISYVDHQPENEAAR